MGLISLRHAGTARTPLIPDSEGGESYSATGSQATSFITGSSSGQPIQIFSLKDARLEADDTRSRSVITNIRRNHVERKQRYHREETYQPIRGL